MTSWIKAVRKLPAKSKEYSFQTTEAGFCSQFNNFFYSYLYTNSLGKKLVVCDNPSPLGVNVHFLKTTFQDISGVEYIDLVNPTNILLDKRLNLTYNFLSNKTNTELRAAAKEFFKFKPAVLDEIKKRNNIPPIMQFDLGVHIRSGDMITTGVMKAIPLKAYIDAIQAFQKQSAKLKLNIFLMTDNYEMFEQLKAKGDKSWSFTTLPSAKFYAKGHIQGDFNLLPRKTKEDMYYNFLTELTIMKKIPSIICTFSSNVGRFLYLTCDSADKIKSLDTPIFTVF
jgi:hypothetical protein